MYLGNTLIPSSKQITRINCLNRNVFVNPPYFDALPVDSDERKLITNYVKSFVCSIYSDTLFTYGAVYSCVCYQFCICAIYYMTERGIYISGLAACFAHENRFLQTNKRQSTKSQSINAGSNTRNYYTLGFDNTVKVFRLDQQSKHNTKTHGSITLTRTLSSAFNQSRDEDAR